MAACLVVSADETCWDRFIKLSSECFNAPKRSKMMEQSRRDFIMNLSLFFGGGVGQIASFLIFQTDNSCGVWLQKQFFNCLTTTSVDWVVFHGQAVLAWYKWHSKLAITFPCLEPSPRQMCFKILLQIGCWRYDQHSNFYLKCSRVQWVTKLPWNLFFCIS